jgi:hypothetical protein
MMMKRNFGPVFGFVKLRLGARRTPVIWFKFSFSVNWGFWIVS